MFHRKKHYSVYLTEEAHQKLKTIAFHSRSRSISDLIQRFTEGDPRVLAVASRFWSLNEDWDPSSPFSLQYPRKNPKEKTTESS